MTAKSDQDYIDKITDASTARASYGIHEALNQIKLQVNHARELNALKAIRELVPVTLALLDYVESLEARVEELERS